jgi:hypothetical protein
MQNFKLVAAQGEITIRRIGGVPKRPSWKGYTPLKQEGGRYIVGHSETGHHHVLTAAGAAVGVLDKPPEGMRILRVILDNPNVLEHLRPFDTHEPITLEPGEYEFRIGREYDPYKELARRQAD